MKWVEVLSPAPILNTPHFSTVFGGENGYELALNEEGHPYFYEFVALPGMCFLFIKQVSPYIFQILDRGYSKDFLYVDVRFCRLVEALKTKPPLSLKADDLLARMEAKVGVPYVWGGNWSEGVPQMLDFYPPSKPLPKKIEELWTFQGLDCSGLLFEASFGATPRNSSDLIHFGRCLEEGEDLLPMDMIIYPGHVLFVRDNHTIIESKSPFGVRIKPLDIRLEELSMERKFVRDWKNDPNSFTVRRFCNV